jgi:hypothetical protein
MSLRVVSVAVVQASEVDSSAAPSRNSNAIFDLTDALKNYFVFFCN